MFHRDRKKIVVIGGGTGTSTVVAGLKNLPVEITAIVSMADSGGSTGRLRDEFGFQPVGDLRQSLAALASKNSQEWIQKLLLYRFPKGEGLKGHNLGNLILTALQDMAGSTTSALEIAEQVFRLNGAIYPSTTDNVQLVIEYEDGQIVEGEDSLNGHGDAKKIREVRLKPRAKLYEKAAQAIENADVVAIGPGDYYSSIMPAICVDGIKEAFASSKAKVVYVVNLMTRYNQTHDMSAAQHTKGIEDIIGKSCDKVIINNGTIPTEILEAYEREKEYPVKVDMSGKRVILADVIAGKAYAQQVGDSLERSLLRHDPKKLAKLLFSL